MNTTTETSRPPDVTERFESRAERVARAQAERTTRRAEAKAKDAAAAGRDGDEAKERYETTAIMSATIDRFARSIDRLSSALENGTASYNAVAELRADLNVIRGEVNAAAARRVEAGNDPSKRFLTAADVEALIAKHDKAKK